MERNSIKGWITVLLGGEKKGVGVGGVGQTKNDQNSKSEKTKQPKIDHEKNVFERRFSPILFKQNLFLFKDAQELPI